MSWALVTGAGRRLGRETALTVARAGWSVIVHYGGSANEAEETVALARAHGVAAHAVQADLADLAVVQALLPRAAEAAGEPIAALVNCASIFEHDAVGALSADAFEAHMRVNTLAPVLLAEALARALPSGADGVVVNFLDFKLIQPYPDHFSYTLSKYALAGATELLSRALAPSVRVNAVAPGYTLPSPGQAQADFERLHAQTPLARGATPADVAAAVLFLLSAPAVTGQTIVVDAGLHFRSRERDLAFS